ncbi:MAG TPA: aminotransferase class IV [Dehalococcoidales bacterium]|nr:aminotransferase class IV [Dehalococcoidales bacterium]
MADVVYLNGSLVPRSEARVSVADHGFLYGYGLFETMRAYHGRIFALERHIGRLLKAAEVIGLGDSPGGIDLAGACRDTLKANNLEEARLRLTVTNGESEAFPWAGGGGKPSVVVTARPFTPFPPEKYEQGFRVSVASVRRCCQYQLSGIKSTGYLVSVLARREAAARGFDEALLLNERGHIAEGGTSNVFFVKAAALVTPSLEAGILPGITRELVLGLAASLGISVSQREIGVPELAGFDEAFLTASTLEIMPLVAVRDEGGKDITIGPGRPGDVTRKLMAAYREMVARETAG